MQVCDQRTEKVHFGDGTPRTMTGTVVWIHPQRRFYVVEFKLELGTVRESYFFPSHGRMHGE